MALTPPIVVGPCRTSSGAGIRAISSLKLARKVATSACRSSPPSRKTASSASFCSLLMASPSTVRHQRQPRRVLVRTTRRGLCAHGLQREERCEETDPAGCHHRPEFSAWLSHELARDPSRPDECLSQVAKVSGVLDERVRVPVPLEDDALR